MALGGTPHIRLQRGGSIAEKRGEMDAGWQSPASFTMSISNAFRGGMVYHFGTIRLLAFVREFQNEHLFFWKPVDLLSELFFVPRFSLIPDGLQSPDFLFFLASRFLNSVILPHCHFDCNLAPYFFQYVYWNIQSNYDLIDFTEVWGWWWVKRDPLFTEPSTFSVAFALPHLPSYLNSSPTHFQNDPYASEFLFLYLAELFSFSSSLHSPHQTLRRFFFYSQVLFSAKVLPHQKRNYSASF